MKFSTAANGALLYATMPVFVLVLSHFILKERITARKTIGIGLAFLGIAIVISFLQWSGIFYLGIGTSIVGYFLWYYALGKIDASKVAVFANGQPVFATILALMFLDYSITANIIAGALVATAGVMLTQLG